MSENMLLFTTVNMEVELRNVKCPSGHQMRLRILDKVGSISIEVSFSLTIELFRSNNSELLLFYLFRVKNHRRHRVELIDVESPLL